MSTRAISDFEVTGWEQSSYGEEDPRPVLGKALVSKSYTKDLVAKGKARLLMCQADPDDRSRGAGYVASEVVTGKLDGRTGTFVIQHWGVMGPGTPPSTGGYVVPGSGTGELAGISGKMEINVTPDGKHTLTLDYEIGPDTEAE